MGPRTRGGVYSEEVTGLSNPNYTIAPSGNSAGTLTIDPLTVTYGVANASSIFGTIPILGPATLFGVLPGDLVDPTVGAFPGSGRGAAEPPDPGRAIRRTGDGDFESRITVWRLRRTSPAS